MTAQDKDRTDEQVQFEASYIYNDLSGEYETQLIVKNTGIIDVKISSVWILDEDGNEHRQIECDIPISVGNFKFLEDTELKENLEILFQADMHSYSFKIVTERGNIAISRLIPKVGYLTGTPIVMVPGASFVKRDGGGGRLQLVVFNRATEDILTKLLRASRLEGGIEISEMIEINSGQGVIVEDGVQVVIFEIGTEGQVYIPDEVIFVELIDDNGICVCSYYFECGVM